MKYLPLYYRWMKTGTLPDNGLCNCFGMCFGENNYRVNDKYEDFLLMFPPDHYLKSTGTFRNSYWGADNYVLSYHIAFTPLRQNIVLFLAAMNNEL